MPSEWSETSSPPGSRAARLTRAEQTAAALNAAIRDGHELLQALQLERTRARQDAQELADAMMATVRETFEGMVKGHMEALKAHIDKTKGEATKKVFAEFDKITNILMGREDPEDADLTETARLYRATLETIREQRREEVPEFWRRVKE